MRQHGGWVEFTSEPGAGTEFRVFLPVAPAEEIPAGAAAAAAGAMLGIEGFNASHVLELRLLERRA